MIHPMLLGSTGDERADDTIRMLVADYERIFPGRICGYYVLGSYADGTAVPLSDLDMAIVFHGELTPEESTIAQRVAEDSNCRSPIRLNINIAARNELSVNTSTLLKLGSLLVYGDDIRAELRLPPLDAYRRWVTGGPYRFSGQVLRGVDLLPYPLDYPDPDGEFYGYDRKRIAEWYPADVERGTKELVTAMARIATAILAVRAGAYVARKEEAIRLYAEIVGGGWTGYLQALYEKCKLQWHYRIPEGRLDREELRLLCRQTLDFENHYFALHRDYLLGLLGSSEPGDREFAAEQLRRVVYADDSIIASIP